MAKENIHEGHRKRMRDKLEHHGAHVFDTYELVEMLLYSVLPCKDTNPVAKGLLSECGGIDGLLSASYEELLKIDGVGEKTAGMLSAVGKFTNALLLSSANEEIVYDNYALLGDHFLESFSGEHKNIIVLALFDSKMRLIHEEILYRYDYGSAAVRPEAFVSASLKYRATIAVVAHNHPYGPLYPTSADAETNKLISLALRSAGIQFLEHYVISGDSYVGFMNDISTAFAQSSMVKKFIQSKKERL